MSTRTRTRGLAAAVAGTTLGLGIAVVGAAPAHAAGPIGVGTWQELQDAMNQSGPGVPVVIELTADIGDADLDSFVAGGPGVVLPVGGEVTLDLHGHELALLGLGPYAGVQTSGASLTIEATGGGRLTAVGATNTANGAAGIGGSEQDGVDAGTITINGGAVSGFSGGFGAGIGGASGGSGGTVIVNGGIVSGGSQGGSGVGSGRDGASGAIRITGGAVTARSGYDGIGIGGRAVASTDGVTIDGGTVVATGGAGNPGVGGPGLPVAISGGSVTATGGLGSPAIGGGSNYLGNNLFFGPGATVVATSGAGAVAVVGDNVASPSPHSVANHGSLTLVGDQTVFPTGTIRPPFANSSSGVITLKGDLVGTGEVYNDGAIIEDGGLVYSQVPVTVHHYRISYDLSGQPGTAPGTQRVFAASYAAGHVSLPTPPAGFEWQAPNGQPVTATTNLPALFGEARHAGVDEGATLVTLHLARTASQPAPATLTLSGLDRTYDGAPKPVTVTTAPAGIDGVSVTYDGSPTAPTDAGSYEVVATLTNPGYEAAPVSGTLVISPKEVTGSFTAADKEFDGTTAATITGRHLTGAVDGDDVAVTGGTASFDTAAVGAGKPVTGTGFTLTGADAGNYLLTPAQPWTTTATITSAPSSGQYRSPGFLAPVDMSSPGRRVWNTIKGGRTVPLKFEVFDAVTGAEVTDVAVIASFTTTRVGCATGTAGEDPIELVTTGGTSLRYDAASGQFVQSWKTPTTPGACYQVTVRLVDGTLIDQAFFEIKR